MVCVTLLVFILFPLTDSDTAVGGQQASPCPARWRLLGDRCLAFYPVWSSWSAAESSCSQQDSNLASLHSQEESQFVLQLTDRHTDIPVWLGGYQAPQGSYWLWSDGSPFTYNAWANQTAQNTREGGSCMEMSSKDGQLKDEWCGEMRFYVCSSKARLGNIDLRNHYKTSDSGIRPGVSVFDVLRGYSEVVANEVLHSPFVQALHSDRLSAACYISQCQQEAAYLFRLCYTLQELVGGRHTPDNVTQLLQDTHTHYRTIWSKYQNLSSVDPSLSVRVALQSFHSVVLEEPVYWLVALSARSSLLSYLTRELLSAPSPEQGSAAEGRSNSNPRLMFRPDVKANAQIKRPPADPGQDHVFRLQARSFLQEWIGDNQMEDGWTDRYRAVIETWSDRLDIFKAVNIFRIQMINQKALFRTMSCSSD